MSTGSVMNRPVDFTSATNSAFLWLAEMSRASMTPTLSAKISSPSLSTTPQRSPSPSKPSPTSARFASTASRMACSIFRSSVIEFAVERHDLAADFLQDLRREGARGAVAAGAHHLEVALDLVAFGQVGDVARGKILDEVVCAAAFCLEPAVEHDVFEARHLVGAEGERPVNPHLYAGPAVVIVRSGDHGDARHVEIELR